MKAATLLPVLGGVIAVLLAVAGVVGVWAALRGGKSAQVLATFRGLAESWEKTAAQRKEELDDTRAKLAALHAEVQREKIHNTEVVAALQSKVATLQEVVTGQQAVNHLSEEMNSGFKRIEAKIDRIRKAPPHPDGR